MKGSVLKSIVIRVVLIFVVLTLIFGIGFRHMIRNIIMQNSEQRADITLEMYINLIVSMSVETGLPFDSPELSGNLDAIGEDMCGRFALDYIYIYTPYAGEKSSFIVSAASNKLGPQELKEHADKLYRNNEGLRREEQEVWNGTKDYAYMISENDLGHEFDLIRRAYDAQGNKYLVGVDLSYDDMLRSTNAKALIVVAVTVGVFSGAMVVFYLIIRKKIQKPAAEISRAMSEFSKEESKTAPKLPVIGKDEFSMISRSFNTMAEDITSYIEKISKLNEENATRTTELRVASNIQKGLLPAVYDRRRGYEINAMMTPAKDIGGDLYDYIQIDSENLLLVMADVSGKGLYASLFMAITLILIRNAALSGRSPSEILESVNNTLCARNPENIFVTAFVAVFNTDKKTLTYSNAGHNLPYVLGDSLITLSGGGIPLGLFGDEKYPSESISLREGDILFMYTDGVNEAVNKDNKFFGIPALEKLLAEHKARYKNDSVPLIERIENAISDFSCGADQSDDITMLSMKLMPENIIEVCPSLQEFEKIKEIILKSKLPEGLKLSMCLAAEEIFVNICSYAFEGKSTENEKISFSLEDGKKSVMIFEDGGMKYDPTENVTTADEYDIDSQLGGLGKLIAFSVADEVKYEYKDNKNILTLIKNTEE